METKELFINNLLSKDKELLNEILDEIYPIDTAILLEEIDDDLLLVFCQMVDKKQIAEVIEQSEITLQKRILEHFNMSDVIEIFSYMSNDDITDIIGELPFQLRKDILRYMNKSESNEIEQLLGYAPDTAGGIMTTEYLALKGDLTFRSRI